MGETGHWLRDEIIRVHSAMSLSLGSDAGWNQHETSPEPFMACSRRRSLSFFLFVPP
jgi:hypothetical protein